MKPSPAKIAAAKARQAERKAGALVRLLDWPDGMPPLSALGAGIGALTSLEKDGLVRQLDRDALGDPRFVLTDKGRALVEQSTGAGA